MKKEWAKNKVSSRSMILLKKIKMEIRKIIFIDSKNTENTVVIDTNKNISSFLETFRLEVDEVIELNDAMYTVKAISEKVIDAKNEILVDVEFIDLIENQPTA